MDAANISQETRNEIISEWQQKLSDANSRKDSLEKEIAIINSKIDDYKQLIIFLGGTIINGDSDNIIKDNINSDLNENGGKPTWAQKIIKVLDTPSKYGFQLYRGIDNIFTAIAQEFNESTNTENRDRVKRTLAPTVSRLINDGSIIKMKRKGTSNEYYQVSPNWFDSENKTPLKEYQELLNDYEVEDEN